MKSVIDRLIQALLCVVCLAVVAAGQGKTGIIKGRLTDEKGKGIPDATVRFTDTRDRSVKEAKTDESGNFTMELPPDEYLVGFEAEGFQEASLQALQQVEEGKETHVRTVVLPKVSHTSLVRGSVFNLNGQTLSGVRVTIQRVPTEEETKEGKKVKAHTKEYVTNVRGEFAFRLPTEPARYRVSASAPGFKSDSKFVDVSGSEAVPVALTLLPRKMGG
ncbi:MAG TPA: carboxypeptidase-like regulatory domain-containing protein [Blastocatellia bacterium]